MLTPQEALTKLEAEVKKIHPKALGGIYRHNPNHTCIGVWLSTPHSDKYVFGSIDQESGTTHILPSIYMTRSNEGELFRFFDDITKGGITLYKE